MMADDFQVQGGNGRLYPLDAAKKEKEEKRLADLFAGGQKWATPDKMHGFDGYMQVSQQYIDWLQACLDNTSEELMRCNWKGTSAAGASGKFLKIQDLWTGNGNPSFKQFKDGQGAAPKPEASVAPVLEDSDIPF
tara:strand:- start:42 stop:446 length:405 start_codon:yes stop_codon:yes gene_type:complete